MVMLDGGYDAPCVNATSAVAKCDVGFDLDAVNGVCYKVLPTLMNYDEATTSGCSGFDAEVVDFESDHQARALLKLLAKGFSLDINNQHTVA